jgi:hypothetical protein
MDARQRAFLNAVVDDLAASRSHDSGTVPARHTTRRSGVNRAVAGALLAGAAFVGFSATAAHAGPPARTNGAVIQSDCFTPDFIPQNHSKTCTGGIAFVSYKYLYTYSPNQVVVCYMFDATYYGCGGSTDLGRRPLCFR